jgi:hypothetical protein
MSDFTEYTNRVRDSLISRAEDFSPSLFGAPNKALSSNRQLRFGKKGSIAVELSGQKRGLWCDYENDSQGGDPYKAVMREKGVDFVGAVEYGAWWLSLDPEKIQPRQERRASAKVERINQAQDARLRINIDRILGECRSRLFLDCGVVAV